MTATQSEQTLSSFASASNTELTEYHTLPAMLRDRFETDAHGVVFRRKSTLGDCWIDISVAQFYDQVIELAQGFVALGIKKGDVVATMSHTRYELSLLDFALWSLGAIHVLIYETSSAAQARHILQDASVKLIIAENSSLASLLHQAKVEAKRPAYHAEIYTIEENGLAKIVKKGRKTDPTAVYQAAKAVRGNDVATIIYTSGTTGVPKGVELTHTNFYAVVANGINDPHLHKYVSTRQKSTLLFLPMAHIFARFISIFPIYSQAILGHAPGAANLVADLASFKPTFLLVVPRVLEKVYNSADQKLGHGPKQKFFRMAAKVSEKYAQTVEAGKSISPLLRLQWHLYNRSVYSKILALMGGRLECVISGGAPLGKRLGYFYTGLGLQLLEGYGLTETCAPISVNLPKLTKIGTVGKPYPGIELRISETGEIEARGDQIFTQYHNMPKETAAAFDDGWFKTGDIGKLDKDGYLTITGRQKELIVTAGGKNVAPAALEDKLRGHPLISQVVVVGDKRPFVSALITLDADMLPGWLANHGIAQMSVDDAAEDPQVLAALDRAVKRTNASVSRAESIRKFKVLTCDFTEANGFLTPSLKVKRRQVLEAFASVIDDIYTR